MTYGSAWCHKRPQAVAGRYVYRRNYSITSSARAISEGGTVSPNVLAVFKLTVSSNLVGCCTGRSAGLAPLKILSTKLAERRKRSGRLGPNDIGHCRERAVEFIGTSGLEKLKLHFQRLSCDLHI